MCRETARSSRSTTPSLSHVAYAMPVSISSRIAAPSAASRNIPVGPMNLSAFHSMGLWLADSITPPAAWWCSTASWQVGVVVSPMSMTVQPTDCSAPVAMRWNMGPDTRLSRPRTIVRDGPAADAQAPNAAA